MTKVGTPTEVITEEAIRLVFGVRVSVLQNEESQRPHVVLGANSEVHGPNA